MVIPQVQVINVGGADGSATFCPNNFHPGLDTDNEIWLSTETCNSIHNFLSNYGDNVYNYKRINARWYDYTSVISALNSLCYKATIFSKGHNTPWGNPYHFQLIDLIGEGVRDSQRIYPYTSGARNRFVFLWHCATAHSYPSQYDEYGWRGHAYCWTRQNYMSTNGYWSSSGAYVFLGFSNYSHQFEDYVPGHYPFQFAHFAYLVIQSLSYGNTVREALDDASQTIYGKNFYQTPLYYGETFGNPPLFSKMKIFGNGARGLP